VGSCRDFFTYHIQNQGGHSRYGRDLCVRAKSYLFGIFVCLLRFYFYVRKSLSVFSSAFVLALPYVFYETHGRKMAFGAIREGIRGLLQECKPLYSVVQKKKLGVLRIFKGTEKAFFSRASFLAARDSADFFTDFL